jgi:hypothetical protein
MGYDLLYFHCRSEIKFKFFLCPPNSTSLLTGVNRKLGIDAALLNNTLLKKIQKIYAAFTEVESGPRIGFLSILTSPTALFRICCFNPLHRLSAVKESHRSPEV